MRRLLIFLKYPAPGQVKTRLASELGNEAAAEIYRASVELTLSRLEFFRRESVICVDPPEAVEKTRQWLEGSWQLCAQQGATLGDRLKAATRQAFAEGAKRVIVIGTDSPWLFPADIARAFETLEGADIALGPTEDGGYYLIGLSKDMPLVFDGIAWSSPTVFDETLARAQALQLRVRPLERGYDLDYAADVERFVTEESMRGHSSSMVNTMATLINRRRK